MPTLAERLTASKLKAEQAIARKRKIEAQLDKLNRKRDVRMKIILGSGAIAAKLVDQCLQHVCKEDRAFALEVLQTQAEAAPADEAHKRTDRQQDSPNA